MVQWRDVGYVADSDDEDLDLESEESQEENDRQAANNVDGQGEDRSHHGGELDAAQSREDIPRRASSTLPQKCQDSDARSSAYDLKHDSSGTAEDILVQDARPGEYLEIEEEEYTQGNSRQDDDIDELQLPGVKGTSLSVLTPGENVTRSSRAIEDDIFDVPSSPLSDAPSNLSDEELQPVTLSTSAISGAHDLSTRQPDSIAHTSGQITLSAAPLDHELSISGRIFRRRNPIQLHPYILEQEQYKQSLKARGLRPVAIASSPHRQDDDSQEQETQVIQGGGAEDSQDVDFRGSSPARSSPPPEPMLLDVPDDRSQYDSDELPDLSKLIGNATILTEKRGRKRRKVLQTYSRNAANHTYPQPPNARTDSSVENRLQTTPAGDIYDLPTSADEAVHLKPTSVQTRRRKKKFRAPRGLEPIQLPTPETSSQTPRTRAPSTPLFPELSDSESDPPPRQSIHRPKTSATRHPAQVDEVVDISSSESAESSASESEHLRKVSHRLRGVLPASWLRLDQHAQTRKQRAPAAESPARTQQRGVAQHRSRSHTETPHSAKISLTTILELSDDSASPSKRPKESLPSTTRNAFDMIRDQSDFTAVDSQDIVEDDFVDPMLPTTTRQRRPGGKKRQSKLTYAFERVAKSSDRKHDNTSSGVPGSRSSNQSKQRRQFPRLSILDSRSLPPIAQQPDFLRIATRHARSRNDKARHSPRIKIIQLQDRRNDTEAGEVLGDWLDGRLKPREHNDQLRVQNLARAPLRERSDNQRSLPSGKKRQSSTLQRLLCRPLPQKSQRQSSLDDLAPRPSASSVSGEPKDLPTPRTKSGRTDVSLSGPGIPGQLESVRRERPATTHRSAFRGELQMLNKMSLLQAPKEYSSNFMLERYLQGDLVPFEQGQAATSEPAVEKPAQVIRRQRKRTPTRLNIEEADIDYFESFSTTSSIKTFPGAAVRPPVQVVPRLRTIEGLGPFGTYYTNDFDIKHLPTGTYFRADTFIGSGGLFRAMSVNVRDLDKATYQKTPFQLGQQTVYLGAWTEEVSDQLNEAITVASEQDQRGSSVNATKDRMTNVLRQLISYVSTSLYFLDPIDRNSFVQAMTAKTQQLTADPARSSNGAENSLDTQYMTYVTILLSQLYPIATSIVSKNFQVHLEGLLRQHITACAGRLFRDGLIQTWSLHSRLTSADSIDTSIGVVDWQAECIVIHCHLLKVLQLPGLDFTLFVDMGLAGRNLSTCNLVSVFDRTWHDIFAIIPLIDFDEDGIVTRSSISPAETLGPLDCICTMLRNLFELYRNHLCDMSRPINTYVRATLSRCFVLIRRWSWRRCENTLGTVFDLFAQNGFSLLRNEDGIDSPRFLKELDKDIMPSLDAGDRSFDIFLKALYVGLHNMRSTYANRKIRNIAWRFIPNHGRQHDKGSELKPADLQTLRNTHDLLTVLYTASPAGFRPNLDLIRNLVNFSSSHAEACKLNIRTWANLARFTLSRNDEVAAIESFSAWYNDMISELLTQYRQARSEAQAQAHDSGLKGFVISKNLLESAIANNQKQIANVIITALAALGDVLQHALSDAQASELFQNLALPVLLGLFSDGDNKVSPVLISTLEVYEVMYKRKVQPRPHTSSNTLVQQESNEDSQDFGDFPDIEDFEDVTLVGNDVEDVKAHLYQPVHQLLSNAFGTESYVDDKLLTKVVDVWSRACGLLVNSGQRSWSYFLDAQSSGSWSQLRDTNSKRKYFPYFIRSILETAPDVLLTHIIDVVSAWLITIVERESMLKFQHLLTAALLNANPDHPLLANIPFVKDTANLTYKINLAEFSQRRLATISTVLANMRSSLESALLHGSDDLKHLRHDYQYLVRQVMTAMKKNYQELEQGSTARGAYVDFVQKVVENLQQYTSDICPIDRFFTDSAAFPLPASDPTYVVGRLKSYGLKSNDHGEQKKLAIFFQAVCERAAVDNQQSYLIEQLVKSVEGTREGGCSSKPTLRTLLIRGIFPAFLESAFRGDCGWILAVPIMEALSRMNSSLWYCFSLSDKQGVDAVLGMLTDTLLSLQVAYKTLLDNPNRLRVPCLLATMAVAFNVCQTCAPLVDYIHRSSQQAGSAVACLLFFRHFSRIVVARLQNHSSDDDSYMMENKILNRNKAHQDQPFTDIRRFCTEELARTLTTSWHRDGEDYFVIRGNGRRQVLLDVGDYDEESRGVLQAMKAFEEAMAALPTFSGHSGWQRPVEMRFKDDNVLI